MEMEKYRQKILCQIDQSWKWEDQLTQREEVSVVAVKMVESKEDEIKYYKVLCLAFYQLYHSNG